MCGACVPVVSDPPSHHGVLQIIDSGFAIIHDRVRLQKRASANGRAESKPSPSRISVDTRLAAIGRGSLLFSERRQSISNEQRAEAMDHAVSSLTSDDDEEDCAVVDSPVVQTLSVLLVPHKQQHHHHHHVNQASSRTTTDFFADALLGKGGLSALRKHIREHRVWRTNNAAFTSRVLATSRPRETLTAPTLKQKLGLVPNAAVRGTSPPLELTRFLKDRELLDSESHLVLVPERPTPSHSSHSNPRALLPSRSPLVSPKPHGPLGSFSTNIEGGAKDASPRSTEPASSTLPQLASPPKPWCSSPSASLVRLKDQLKRDERVLETLSSLCSVSTTQRSLLESERQRRRRHGRPPPKIVENRGLFVDEHAFTAVTTLHQQHDRKKRGLCRRLLHLK